MMKHIKKAVMPLPEPINQLQNHVQSQTLPRPLSQHPLIDPVHIPNQIGPKIEHRPTPSYHDPYARPPPKPPNILDPLGSWKDLLDSLGQKSRNRRKFSISGRYNFGNL